MQRIYIYIYVSVNARKLEKVGVMFFFPSTTRSPPQLSTSLIWFFCPKVFSLSYFLGCIWSPAAPFSSLSIPLSFFLFPSSPLLTWQPSLSHQNKTSLSKEEIKGLTLKFQLPRLWVSNQNFICLFLFLYPLSWF